MLTETDSVKISLSDEKITVNGEDASESKDSSVYVANDIVYYEEGHDFTFGEGEERDAHSDNEAEKHTVVHITKSGKYELQCDLGEQAKNDETAVVTLVLNNVSITSTVAPAIIFYNVYECSQSDPETATATVYTADAGANIIIADNSVNNISGSYVAKIYDAESVILSEDKAQVEDAEKLHKYDGALYSRMSLNVNGAEKGNGILNITAKNEGLDSELHLTVNGGIINIESGNDGINTNEDNVSVTTVNGGKVNIKVNGDTGEGDGIDSNGWLVINGGEVFAQACSSSADAGIDSDMGIHLNGGSVIATGNMLDEIAQSKMNFAVFQFEHSQEGGNYILKSEDDKTIAEKEINNSFTHYLVSSADLSEGEYTFFNGEIQLEGMSVMNGGDGQKGQMDRHPEGEGDFEGIEPPEDGGRLEWGDRGENPPEISEVGEGEMPGRPHGSGESEPFEEEELPEGMTPPEGRPIPEMGEQDMQASKIFKITEGGNYFTFVRAAE